MHEVDVSVSDALLGVVALWLGWRTQGTDDTGRRSSIRVVMFSIATGTWLGALWHGFLSVSTSPFSTLVWRLAMLAAGFTAYGFATFGASMLELKARAWPFLFRLVLAAYALALLFIDDFRLAMAMYLPAVLLALFAFIRRHNGVGVAGLLLVFVASAYQQWGPDLQAAWLTHNTIYHLLLMPALLLFWRGAIGAASA
jgi:general stress protein CsbA